MRERGRYYGTPVILRRGGSENNKEMEKTKKREREMWKMGREEDEENGMSKS